MLKKTKERGVINLGMILTGLNKVRDIHTALLTHIELGTGTTQETAEDTDLEAINAGSETARDSATTTDQQVVILATIPTTKGNNTQITELIWKKNSPELAHSRVTFEPIQKTDTQTWTIKTRWFYKGRFG